LFRAASSQLEFFVGLHLLGSIVLDGLVGGVVFSCSSFVVASAGAAEPPAMSGFSASASFSTFDAGNDATISDPSLSMLFERARV
jgi:hypothetical protein